MTPAPGDGGAGEAGAEPPVAHVAAMGDARGRIAGDHVGPPGPATRGGTPCDAWRGLRPGAALTVVKLGPDGSEVTRYPGTVIVAGAPAPWLAVRATWGPKPVALDGLRFVPGDTLHEFFSPVHPFNAFAVFAPDGILRGWYANVTHPTALDPATDPPTLIWHDLYVDLVALPDGRAAVRDEDELAEAGLAVTDPWLHAAILIARDELLRLFAARLFPFHQRDREWSTAGQLDRSGRIVEPETRNAVEVPAIPREKG